MFAKIHVNGKDAHPLWKYLQTELGGFLTNSIKWNFSKFLIDHDGVPVKIYSSFTDLVQ
jgi:glutathione peroxidase